MDSHAILSALKRASIREIDVAGIKVYIRGLTGKERYDFIQRGKAWKAGDESQRITEAELCSWAMCNADGERIYENADALADTDGHSLETIAAAILDASGLSAAAQARAAGESPASPS